MSSAVKTSVSVTSKKKLPVLMLAAIMLILSAYMVYWAMQKEGYYIDDMFSMMSIRGGELGRPYDEGGFFNTWHTAAELESTVGVTEENAFSDIGGSSSLYWNLLHIAYSLTPGKFSVWPSFVLNMFFYIGVLIFIYKLSKLFISNEYLALLPVMVWGISSAAVNTVVLVRFYSFKVLICVLLAYIMFKAAIDNFSKWRHLIFIIILMGLGATTHQYFFVYAFFLTALVCIYLLSRKKIKPLLKLTGAMAIGIAAYLIYTGHELLKWLQHPGGMYGQSIERLVYGTDDFPSRIAEYFSFISRLTFAGINMYAVLTFVLILIVITGLTYVKKGAALKRFIAHPKVGLWLLASSVCLFYILTIARISPGAPTTERYMFCITPLLVVLLVSLLVYAMKALGFKSVATVFTTVAIPCIVLLTVGFADIHVYREDKTVSETLRAHRHLPVVCINSSRTRPALYYWQLFEFENKVLFSVESNINYDDISELSFDDGLILVVDSWHSKFDTTIANLYNATGLGEYLHIATLDRYAPVYYYLLY